QGGDGEAQEKTNAEAWSHPLFPKNYECCAGFLAFIYTVILIIFGKGTNIFKRIGRKKEKHIWSNQVMNELLMQVSLYEYDGNGSSSGPQDQDQGTSQVMANLYLVCAATWWVAVDRRSSSFQLPPLVRATTISFKALNLKVQKLQLKVTTPIAAQVLFPNRLNNTLTNSTQGDEELSAGEVVIQEQEGSK
ncbi:hypothetical protein S245_067481, partial [Arachis hypogaea]